MIKTFVCNLKRCEDRRQYVKNNYPKSLDIEIFTGYDGHYPKNNSIELKNLGIKFKNNMKKNKQKKNIKNHWMMNDHKKGEFGCLVSYLYFLKKFINSNLEIAIFSDDDLSFEENFSEKLNELITNNLPDNFNIIYLCAGGGRNYHYPNDKKINNLIYERDLNNVIVDSCCLISKKGAKIIYDLLMNKFKGNLGRDYAINELFKKYNHKLHIIKPTIVWAKNEFPTTVQS
tara:strand:+ start:249 stop:938 length:690 start_codon:yes stop_codon:yes gene_type:complete